MKQYDVIIEETVADTFHVTAASVDEALEIAEQKYKKGGFVLEPGDLMDVQFFVNDEE